MRGKSKNYGKSKQKSGASKTKTKFLNPIDLYNDVGVMATLNYSKQNQINVNIVMVLSANVTKYFTIDNIWI